MKKFDIKDETNKKNIKNKASKVRIFNDEGYSLRGSGVLWESFKKKRTLLIKNKKGFWSLSGGAFESADGNLFETSIRESKEEAGVLVRQIDFVGEFKNEGGKIRHITSVWNLVVIEELKNYDEDYRERKWFSNIDAITELEWNPVQQNIFIQSLRNSNYR